MALETIALMAGFFFVTLCAVIHFHPIPGMFFNSKDILAPDITAVAADAVFLVRPQGGGSAVAAVAVRAIHLAGNDMGCV